MYKSDKDIEARQINLLLGGIEVKNILDSFVEVAPYINKLCNGDFAVSVTDLEKCLIYVPSHKQNHRIRSGDPHTKGSVAYESIQRGRRVVKRVGSEVFGFPYIAIALPLKDDEGNILGAVSFTEAVDRQDLVLALADNLYDTMKQMLSITELISENSLKLRMVGESLKEIIEEDRGDMESPEGLLEFTRSIDQNLDKLLKLSSDQIEINTYISNLVREVNKRTVKLRESARELRE